jgi:hypothetical protein
VALARFARLNSWPVVTESGDVALAAARLGFSERSLAVAGFFALFVLVSYLGLATRWRPTGGGNLARR